MQPHPASATKLMVVLCRSEPIAQETLAEIRRLRQPGPWNVLMEAAHAHRVHGIVLGALESLGELPTDQLAELKLLRRQAAGWELEQFRVLARLEKRGVQPVVLKGGALRYQVYSEPALRPVADLDLLLPLPAIAPARAALEALGYRDGFSPEQTAKYARHHFHFVLKHPGGFVIELHWGLTLPRPGIRIDPAEVRNGAIRFASARLPILAPRPEHMVVHLVSQCADDRFGRLIRIADIDRVIRTAGAHFDWALLREVATRGHLHVTLGVALRLAQLLLGTPLQQGFIDGLNISPLRRRNIAILQPVSWLLTQRGLRVASAGTVLEFWLETAPGARRELLLKLLGLREEPMEFPETADPEGSRARWVNWLPAGIKLAAYQAGAWAGAAAAGLGFRPRGELRFWSGKGA